MIWLEIQAPFAVCRPFVAGWYRPTAGFLTYTAVYGLILNVARIEMRLGEHEPDHDGKTPATLIKPEADLRPFRLALGVPEGAETPAVRSLFQQLHNYPVGADSGIAPELAKGRKNNITPVRRELLCNLHALAVVDSADGAFEADLCRGLSGELNAGRYGLPFLGDNNFLPDRLAEATPRPARWYSLVVQREGRPREGTTRLTTWIDRADMSATRSALFAPEAVARDQPPETAWVPVGSAKNFDEWLREHSNRDNPS
jgi:CRISPR-associated protein Cas5t